MTALAKKQTLWTDVPTKGGVRHYAPAISIEGVGYYFHDEDGHSICYATKEEALRFLLEAAPQLTAKLPARSKPVVREVWIQKAS